MSVKSSSSYKQMSKIFPLSALAIGMGLGVNDASAINTRIVNMLFSSNFRATGNIDFDAATGSYTSIDPFYNAHWTATVVQTFTTPGPHAFTDTGPVNNFNDGIPIGTYNYQFTLAPGQVAAGVFFDWNGNNDIPVLTIYDCSNPDNGCRAAGPGDSGGNNIGGVAMQTPPFSGQAPAFNDAAGGTAPSGAAVLPAPALVLANDISNLNAGTTLTIPWTPSLTGTTAPTCTIVQQPAQGSATVQADCSSGTFTAGSATGSVSFVYRVSVPGGDLAASGAMNTDDGTVNVTVSSVVPPTAADDTAATAVNTAVDIDVLANDSATTGAMLDPASVAITQQPASGSATVNTVTGVITYTPAPGFCGSDSFGYTVTDDQPVTSGVGTVNINTESNGQLCSSDNVVISGGSSDPNNDGLVSLSDLLSAGIPMDTGVVQPCIGGCFDFSASGLTPGATAKFVLPLSGPLPVAPLMRKWNGSAWTNFVVTATDSVASAGKVSGRCPSPVSGYTPGVLPGNECIRLIISDGGPNDADGSANGVIVDPSGVGKDNIRGTDAGLGSAAGCSISGASERPWRHLDWMLLSGFIGLLCFWRKNTGK